MPLELTYPGVYIQEHPTGVHTIEGSDTSTTAFVGRAASGPLDIPKLVTSHAEFERSYGGLSADHPLGHAVRQFFENGGLRAAIARVVHRNAAGTLDESAPITDADVVGPELEPQRRGLWLLDQVEQADRFSILCLPPLARDTDVAPSTWNVAIRYAMQRRAFVLVDPPAHWKSTQDVLQGLVGHVERDSHAALYFPRIRAPDPLDEGRPATFAACGAIAGVYARTDAQRGVWQAPAGTDATLRGALGLDVTLTDADSGPLNVQGVNTLRTFPTCGTVVWGARTLAGADTLGSDWKYVPVRRLALYVEESLCRGTQWAQFEANGEPLWERLRLNIGAFMHALFRQGAFQGATPREAYFVKCDRETSSQVDIDTGRVRVLVGFAPLRPAEFVVLRMDLLAMMP
jgi:phage tail sheath protein FI